MDVFIVQRAQLRHGPERRNVNIIGIFTTSSVADDTAQTEIDRLCDRFPLDGHLQMSVEVAREGPDTQFRAILSSKLPEEPWNPAFTVWVEKKTTLDHIPVGDSRTRADEDWDVSLERTLRHELLALQSRDRLFPGRGPLWPQPPANPIEASDVLAQSIADIRRARLRNLYSDNQARMRRHADGVAAQRRGNGNSGRHLGAIMAEAEAEAEAEIASFLTNYESTSASDISSSFSSIDFEESESSSDDGEVPVGPPDCLSNLRFTYLGDFPPPALSAKALKKFIVRHGGFPTRLAAQLAPHYVIVGQNASPGLLQFAERNSIIRMSQKGLFRWIRGEILQSMHSGAGEYLQDEGSAEDDVVKEEVPRALQSNSDDEDENANGSRVPKRKRDESEAEEKDLDDEGENAGENEDEEEDDNPRPARRRKR